ncbi:MAG: hypothetical protein NWF04_05730 [Candidatus Bathyarchaeota archaeon]|nr:hypothetical protein [Candidatus Bathyarchaeota archaeon]
MPLTQEVVFKTCLQKGNRIQIPKQIRWHFKLEPNQTLHVTLHPTGTLKWEQFYSHTDKTGRINIPKLTLNQLQIAAQQNPDDAILEVTLEPA